MMPIYFRQKRLPCRSVSDCSRSLNCRYRKQSAKIFGKVRPGLNKAYVVLTIYKQMLKLSNYTFFSILERCCDGMLSIREVNGLVMKSFANRLVVELQLSRASCHRNVIQIYNFLSWWDRGLR